MDEDALAAPMMPELVVAIGNAVAAVEASAEAVADASLYEATGNRRDAYVARNLIQAGSSQAALQRLDPLAVGHALMEVMHDHEPVVPFSYYAMVVAHRYGTPNDPMLGMLQPRPWVLSRPRVASALCMADRSELALCRLSPCQTRAWANCYSSCLKSQAAGS